MSYSSEILDAIDRLSEYYNASDYDAGTNPGGMAAGGHRTNFIPSLQDLALVAPAIAIEATAAADSAVDADGSATAAAASAAAALISEGNATAAAAAAQSSAAGMSMKASVRASTTANITLSGAQTIDGVSVIAGDRVLVKNQSSASQNGIYVAASGSWTRATDADTWAELVSACTLVQEGSTQADRLYICTSNAGGTLGSTSVTWSGLSLSALADSLALTQLAAVSANAVLANATGSSASPTAVTVALNRLFGRGASGNLGEITLGTGLSFVGTSLNADVSAKMANTIQDFRLTLTSGTPVTTGDVSAATTIYCTPYVGNSIALYDGTNWNVRSSSEFSLGLGTLTSGRPYDVFCYDNAGTPTLEFLAWTNDTTRATALAYQDGILVKSGTPTRRYIGTFYTTAATTTEDSVGKRYLWNYYNRVARSLFVTDATGTWNYTTATLRQANGAAGNQINFVIGVSEDIVTADLQVTFANTNANVTVIAGFGLDSTSALAGDQLRAAARTQVANVVCSAFAKYNGLPGAGRHYLAWLEYSTATGTTTWTGSNDGSSQTGIRGALHG